MPVSSCTQFNTLGEGMPVSLHVREKKKWRKYPCTVRNNHFIQFKDVKVCLDIASDGCTHVEERLN